MSFDTVAPGDQEARCSSMFQREADPEETALSSQGQKRGCGSVASFRGCFAMLAAGVLMYTPLAVHYLWKELNELKAIPGRHDTLATSSDEYLAMLSRCIQYDPSNPNEVSSGCNWKVSRLTAGEARLQSMAAGAELPTNQELGVAASTSTNYAILNDVFVLGRLGVYTGTCGSNPAAASCTPTFSVRSTNDVTGVVDVGTGLDVTPAGIKAPQVVTSLLDDPTTPGDGGSITVDATLNLGADNLNAAAVTATASVTAPTVTGSTKVVTPLLDDPTTAGDGGSITVDATLDLGADNLNAATVTATTKLVTPLLDDPTTAGNGGSITVQATLDLTGNNGLESATFLHLKYPSTAFPNILTIQSTVSSTYLLDVDALADVLSKPVGSMTLTGATVLIQAARNDPNAVVVEDTNGANVFRIATKDAASGANKSFGMHFHLVPCLNLFGDDLDNSGPPGKFANVFFKGDLVMAQPNMRVVMRTESGIPLVNYCMETGVIGNGPSGLSFATPAQGTCSGLGYDPITSSSTG
eukprot:g59893.t1